MSTSSQYYDYIESIENITANFASKICQTKDEYCREIAKTIATASYVDIDYDTISRAVVLTAGWPNAKDSKGWSEEITLPHKDATVEIGVLSHEPNADPEDVQFGGFLTVLGQDLSPSTLPHPLPLSSNSLTPHQKRPVSKPLRATTPSSRKQPPAL